MADDVEHHRAPDGFGFDGVEPATCMCECPECWQPLGRNDGWCLCPDCRNSRHDHTARDADSERTA